MSLRLNYVGIADYRVIKRADIIAHGLTDPGADLIWSKANSYELDVSEDIALFLITQGDFATDDELNFGEALAYVASSNDLRGGHDASSNLYPSTGGSGAAGAIRKGDLWFISVAGTLGGQAVAVGDELMALINAPGQTSGNWGITSHALGYVPATAAGLAQEVTDSLHKAGAETVTGAKTYEFSTLIDKGSEKFNVLGFPGVIGSGLHDDSAGILLAIAASEAEGPGDIFLPPGYTFAIEQTLDFAGSTGIQASPGALIKAQGALAGLPMITVEGATAFGNRYGAFRDLRLDGNSIAAKGLVAGASCVQRHFENVDVRNATSQGVVLAGAQNNTFVSLNAERNGGAGADDANLVLDLGAGNNAFFRAEVSQPSTGAGSKRNILFRMSGAAPTGAFNEGPCLNRFYGAQIERSGANATSSIEHRAGRLNGFWGSTISAQTAIPLLLLNQADVTGSVRSELLHFEGTAFQGDNSGASIATMVGFTGLSLSDCFTENVPFGFNADAASSVDLFGKFQTAITAANLFTGAGADANVATQRLLRLDGVPTGTLINQIANSVGHHYDATNHRVWFFAGAWRSLQLFEVAAATLATTENNYAASPKTGTVRVTPAAGGTTITGIVSNGSGSSGSRLRFINASAADNLTLAHQSASSSVNNRIICPDAVSTVVAPGETVDIEFDNTSSKWRVIKLSDANKAPLASPAFTGNPTAPTQSAGNNSTRLATTAYTDAAIAALVGTAPGVLDTLGEISDAINDDANLYTTLTTAINAKVADAINDGTTTIAPSQNAVFDALALKAAIRNDAFKPTAAIAETMPRSDIVTSNLTSLTLGRQSLYAIWLPAGTIVSSITLFSGTTAFTAGATTNNKWFTLYDSARALLAQTADDGATAWAANSAKTLAIAKDAAGGAIASFTTTYTGLHYVGVMVGATGGAPVAPSVLGTSSIAAVILGQVPILNGHDATNTGLTTTPPNPTAALTSTASRLYAYVS